MLRLAWYTADSIRDSIAKNRFAGPYSQRAWLTWKAFSRLRLNSTKTQVMWLGSQQLLARLDIADVPALSSTMRIQQSTRDVACVVIDS